jgi:hypothetical protein
MGRVKVRAIPRRSVKWVLRKASRRWPLPLAEVAARQLASMKGNPGHDTFYRRGFHLLRRSYYSPIPEVGDIDSGYWDQLSDLPGIDLNEGGALDLMREVFPEFLAEFRERFPNEKPADWQPGQFYLINGSYMAVDAQVYYALIRHHRPARIVEIGAGNSTLVAIAAGAANAAAGGSAPKLTSIEPYPWGIFRDGLPGLSELITKRLQEVDLGLFETLEAGDILFIDSSHVLRAGNDVELEYLEILPRLKPGVLVHIHDISLPERYPRVYFEEQNYWNEQQLLQAFLAFNSAFEVLWPGNAMLLRHRDEVMAAFPEIDAMRAAYPSSEPTAFWIRRRN